MARTLPPDWPSPLLMVRPVSKGTRAKSRARLVDGGAGQAVVLHAEHPITVGGRESDREAVMLVEPASHALYGDPAVVLQDVHEEASGCETLPELVQRASAEFAVPGIVKLCREVIFGE